MKYISDSLLVKIPIFLYCTEMVVSFDIYLYPLNIMIVL